MVDGKICSVDDCSHDEAWMHDPETLAQLEEIDRIYEGVEQ